MHILIHCSHFLFTDSGNGTGSTNSSRPQSQVITDPHATSNNSSDSPQTKPSLLTIDKASKEVVQLLPDKKHGDSPSSEVEKLKETFTAHNSADFVASNSSAKNKPIDTTDGTTGDTTNDVAKDSDTNKDTTSDTIKDATSDTIKNATSDSQVVESKVVINSPATDTISDITENRVTDNEAWSKSGKLDATIDADEQKVNVEKSPQRIYSNKTVDTLDLKNKFEEVENDDVFASELPAHIRKPNQLTPMSPNLSPSLSLSGYSPVNMSPRTGRRSSFVS